MLFYFVVVCGGDVEVIFVVAAVLVRCKTHSQSKIDKKTKIILCLLIKLTIRQLFVASFNA